MSVEIPEGYRPSDDEPYMGPTQLEYFRRKLLHWRNQILGESGEVFERLKEKSSKEIDMIDQGRLAVDHSLEVKTRDRYRKLIRKIDEALERIENGTYGYCEETGEEIGIARLEARPIVSLPIEAQKRHETLERTRRFGYRKK